MKIWIAVLFLVFLVPLVAVSTVAAAKPSMGMGTVTLTSSTVLHREVLNHHSVLVIAKNTFSVTGNLSGTAVAIERDLMHNVTRDGKTVTITTFHGNANFTGTLGGKSGTLVVRYEGRNNSTFIRGTFTVSHGTGQLTGVHGQGRFHGSALLSEGHPSPLDYTIHWSTHTHHGEDTETGTRDHNDEHEDD